MQTFAYCGIAEPLIIETQPEACQLHGIRFQAVMMAAMTVGTIDDVVAALGKIIEQAWGERNRMGYFAALYRRVTRSVRDGLTQGRFQNPAVLERLDVVFAKRYLDALAEFQSGGTPTRSWALALGACADSSPLILQHLLAGMNAHINLDLGIASAATSPGAQLAGLKPDFDQINAILAEQVGAVESELTAVSPLLGTLAQIGLRTNHAIANFSMEKARQAAWLSAERLAATPPVLLEVTIDGLDLAVSVFGQTVLYPLLLGDELRLIREAECEDVRKVIETLAAADAAGVSAS
jgi:hypothetical protein